MSKSIEEQLKEKFVPAKAGGPLPAEPEQLADAALAADDVDDGGIDILNNLTEDKLDALISLLSEKKRVKTVEKDTKRHVTDFSAIQEQDIFNLDIPIEAISHEAPDFMIVKLANPEFVARWIFNHPKRIGVMKAMGFTFATPEDLGEKLVLEIDVNANGNYQYIDTVLMKIPKRLYYGRLRKQFLRSKDAIKSSSLHERMRVGTNAEMASMPDNEGRTYGAEFNRYNKAGNIGAYVPATNI